MSIEWQPIETAPKDGTVILLHRRGDVVAGWWRGEPDYPWAFVDSTREFVAVDEDGEGRDCIEPNAFRVTTGPTQWAGLPPAPRTE